MSRAATITTRSIETVKPTADRQEISDHLLPGFYLIVQPLPSGAKRWAVRYRINGRTRKHTLGSYPAFDLAAARALVRETLRAVAEGRDPGREKAHHRATLPDA